MAKVRVSSGVCGFTTTITALPDGKRSVKVALDTDCPNIKKAVDKIGTVDPFRELFGKLHDSEIYKTLSPVIPHPSCLVPPAALKAAEVAAGLALPKDAHISMEK